MNDASVASPLQVSLVQSSAIRVHPFSRNSKGLKGLCNLVACSASPHQIAEF